MNRATWLAALGAAALPIPVRAQAPALQVGAGLIEPQAQAYYARANGFFKAHGLDANVVTLANGSAISAAVAGGSVQIGITSVLGLAQAIGRGLPFATFAPGGIHDSRYPASGLLVAADSKLASAKELSGKVVGVSTLKGLDQLVVSVLIDKTRRRRRLGEVRRTAPDPSSRRAAERAASMRSTSKIRNSPPPARRRSFSVMRKMPSAKFSSRQPGSPRATGCRRTPTPQSVSATR